MGFTRKRGRFYTYCWDEYETLPDGSRRRHQRTKPLKVEDAEAAGVEEDTLNQQRRDGGLGFLSKGRTWDGFVHALEREMLALRRKPKTVTRMMGVLKTFSETTHVTRPAEAEAQGYVTTYIQARQAVGRKDGTVRLELRTLAAAFTRAVKWKFCRANPFQGISKAIRTVKRKDPPRFLTRDEFQRLKRAARASGDDLEFMCEMFVYQGHRMMELAHAWSEDVDLAANVVRVRAHPCAGECGEIHHDGVWTPKDYEEGDIPLHPLVRKRFRAKRRPAGLLFRRFGFVPWTEDALENVFRRLFKNAKIKGANIRALRHTFGSWMGMRGVPPRTLQKWMRHSKIETTMIYCQVDDQHSQEAMKKAAAPDLVKTR